MLWPMIRTPLGRAGASLAALLLSSSAWAQNSATAAALFERGVSDLEAGRYQTACPAIEESQRLDPRPGTLFTLAECHARSGKAASAVAEYQEYLDLVARLGPEQRRRHEQRLEIARGQLEKLKPGVPMLTLLLPESAPSDTFVTRNGVVLKSAALGVPLPVDPGDYLIVTHVPGAPEREAHVTLALGETKTLTLTLPAPATPPSVPAAVSPVGSQPHPAATPARVSPSSNRRSMVFVAAGIGAAGVVVGSVTGALVLSKKSTVNDGCRDHACTQGGLAAANSAQKLAVVSDIGFGVGLAGAAVAVVLLLTGDDVSSRAKSGWQPVVAAAPDGAYAGFAGRY